jgi:hypothetical protein
MLQNNGDHNILCPFGPMIYESKISEEDLKFVKSFAEINRDSASQGFALSGNIKEQRGNEKADPKMLSTMMEVLRPHIINWIIADDQRKLINAGASSEEKIMIETVDYDSMKWHLGNGVWFNFMKQHEFNPLHCHTGTLSGIIMVEVPEVIATEPDIFPMDSNARCPGQLEFVHGSYGAGAHRIIPKTGQIFVFPAELRHQVYPFQSDVERITMSWNVFDISFDKKKDMWN